MYSKRNEISSPKDRPLLSEKTKKYGSYEKIILGDYSYRKRQRLRRVYALYMITSALIATICICLLLYFCVESDIFSKIFDKNNVSIPSGAVTDVFEGVLFPSKDSVNTPDFEDSTETESETVKKPVANNDNIYDFDYGAVPSGETPIIPMDLSLSSYGAAYIHNTTGLSPDLEKLLNYNFEKRIPIEYLSSKLSPTVLIIHTHGTEAYSKKGAISYLDDDSEIARSANVRENVVAVGKAFSEKLSELGVSNVHCEIMHDKDGYRDAYARAEETIKLYLERYPTIKLVIDLHRDSVVKSSGELVRPVTVTNKEATAQVMCVVGSSWGGEANPKWEKNLALSLQFREYLNDKYENLCRPSYLKSSTYNQEIAPYSMLLEIGAAGNSLDEAINAAKLSAEAVAMLVLKINS